MEAGSKVVPLLAKDTVLFLGRSGSREGGDSSAQVHKKTFGATQYPTSLGQNFSLLFRPFGRLIRDKVIVGPRYKARVNPGRYCDYAPSARSHVFGVYLGLR
jgi:hypothetical protein